MTKKENILINLIALVVCQFVSYTIILKDQYINIFNVVLSVVFGLVMFLLYKLLCVLILGVSKTR